MFTYKTVRLLITLPGDGSATARIVAAQQPAETSIPTKSRLFIPYKDYTVEENTRILEMYKCFGLRMSRTGWTWWTAEYRPRGS